MQGISPSRLRRIIIVLVVAAVLVQIAPPLRVFAAAPIEAGDAGSLASDWDITGASAANTDNNVLYWEYEATEEEGGSNGGSTISAGGHHTCAIKTDQTTVCWGNNDYAQSTVPAGTFTRIAAGGLQTCGIKADGTVACWGLNDLGQTNSPAGTFTKISGGTYHTCAIKADQTTACWGYDVYGQSTVPADTFTQISAGGVHTCGIKADQTVTCWGYDVYGQSTPPAGTFTQIEAGTYHTCGIQTDGTAACWGLNTSGQSTPPAGTFTQIEAGESHTCGIKADGTVACWGLNDLGQTNSPAGTFTKISGGDYHNCGLRADGSAECWGYNLDGQSTPPAETFLRGVYTSVTVSLYKDSAKTQLVAQGTATALGSVTLTEENDSGISGTVTADALGTDATAGNTLTLDIAPPSITNIETTIGSDRITFTWETDEAATTRLKYALNPLPAILSSVSDVTGVLEHSKAVVELYPCTTVYAYPISSDLAGNTATGTLTSATTSGCVNDAAVASQTGGSVTTAGGSLSMNGGGSGIALTVPADASESSFSLQIKKIDTDTVIASIFTPSGTSTIGDHTYDIQAITDGWVRITTFDEPISITLSYTDAQVSGYEESSLQIYRWDGSAWQELSDCSVDTDANTVTCTTTHFSTFGLFGEEVAAPETPVATATGGGCRGHRCTRAPGFVQTPAPSHFTPARKKPASASFQARTCFRVLKWFMGNDKLMNRVNDRLLKRFGFVCG